MARNVTAHPAQYAYSANAKGITFAVDPSAYGGGDMGMDNLYTLENTICTDGIAINVAHQDAGDTGNPLAFQGHSLALQSIQDYGQSAVALPLGFDSNGDPTPGTSVSIQEATSPNGAYTFASANDNTSGTWEGNTYKAHYGTPGHPITEPVGEQIVGTFVRADHGFVVNEDDSEMDTHPTSNGDDGRNNEYMGWQGTDDGSTANDGPPTTPNLDGDWYTDPNSGYPPTDGSSFDDIIRTDQSPTSNFNPNDPNSAPSFDIPPNPDTSRVSDCVIDQAAPQTAASYPAPDQNGWYREAVTISLAVHDVYYLGGATSTYYNVDGTGWQSGTSIPVTGDGTHTVQYYSQDSVGDVESTHTVQIQIDGTAPTVSFNTGTCPSSPVILNSTIGPAVWTASDNANGSGLATAATGSIPLDTSTVGQHSVSTPVPSDVAGNVGTAATCTYSVIYNFKGYFAPVSNPPAWNTNNSGSAVPMKFSLTGNQGLGVLASGSPTSQQVSCTTKAGIGSPTPTTMAAGTTFSYDPKSDQYSYTWKTDTSWKGTCRVFTATLNDNTQRLAFFNFKYAGFSVAGGRHSSPGLDLPRAGG
jgi:hypothetical protein